MIELIVVITVIGILTTMTTTGFTSYQSDARDAQRSAQATILAEALEKYYDANGEYPSCSAVSDVNANTVTTTVLRNVETKTLLTPRSAATDTNSIKCQDLTGAAGEADIFAYVGDGSAACATGPTNGACLQWSLKYKEEATGQIKTIASRHSTLIATSGTTTVSGTPVGFTKIDLSWTTVNNALNYTLQRASDSAFSSNLVVSTVTGTTASATGLTPGTLYYFRVMPNATSSTGNWSATVSVTSGHIAAPVVVSTAINSASQITFNWNAIPLAQSYTVNFSTSSIFTSPQVITGVTATSGVISGLTPGVLYYFRVQALAVDDTSSWSSTVSATTAMADNFNRTAATLGVTSTGGFPWTALSGTWSTNGTMATTPAVNSSNPLATINYGWANVDASVGVSSGGGDALYLRVTDATNWIRARVRTWTTSVSTYYPSSYYVAGSYYGGGWILNYLAYVQNEGNAGYGWIYRSYVNGIPTQADNLGPANSGGVGKCTDYNYSQTVYQNAGYWVDNSYWATSYATHYTVILDKSVAGVITTLGTSAELAAPTSLRLRAVGTSIGVFTNGGATAVLNTTEASFTTIGKHGIGRGLSDNNGQGLDNFTIDAL